MDDRGKVAVGAFVVSGTSLLAAHMAFTVSAEPTMLAPVLVAQLRRRPGRGRAGAVPEKRTRRNRKSSVRYRGIPGP